MSIELSQIIYRHHKERELTCRTEKEDGWFLKVSVDLVSDERLGFTKRSKLLPVRLSNFHINVIEQQ